jgi:hypothetical protein
VVVTALNTTSPDAIKLDAILALRNLCIAAPQTPCSDTTIVGASPSRVWGMRAIARDGVLS